MTWGSGGQAGRAYRVRLRRVVRGGIAESARRRPTLHAMNAFGVIFLVMLTGLVVPTRMHANGHAMSDII